MPGPCVPGQSLSTPRTCWTDAESQSDSYVGFFVPRPQAASKLQSARLAGPRAGRRGQSGGRFAAAAVNLALTCVSS